MNDTIKGLYLALFIIMAMSLAFGPPMEDAQERQKPDVILHDGRECVTLDPQGEYLECEARYGDEVVGEYLCYKSN